MSEVSSYPLSDQLEGALHPVETLTFFGHEAIIKSLQDGFDTKRFHHGWIFSGPVGVGKATLSYHLTRALLGMSQSEGVDDFMQLSRQIAGERDGKMLSSFAHPNVRVLRKAYDEKTKKFKRFITIDEVRSLKAFLQSTPAMACKRVVIIDRAEDMNEAASNALLKMLEEPPAETIFLLISGALGSLPITIRSRCRVVKFGKLNAQDFEKAIKAQLAEEQISFPQDIGWGDLYHLSNGCVRHGLELILGEGFQFYHLLLSILSDLPDLNQNRLDKYIDGVLLDKSGQGFKSAVQMMDEILQRLIKGHAASLPLSGHEEKLSTKLIGAHNVEGWLEVWQRLNQALVDVEELNLDKRSYLMQSIFGLREMAR